MCTFHAQCNDENMRGKRDKVEKALQVLLLAKSLVMLFHAGAGCKLQPNFHRDSATAPLEKRFNCL